MRRARAGRTDPVLLVAEQQTAGRGRLGRGWHSGAGDSLTFSLGLPLAPADWSGLSLAVGVSAGREPASRASSSSGPTTCGWTTASSAGILIETASFGEDREAPRYAVIGVGINIAAPQGDGLSTAAGLAARSAAAGAGRRDPAAHRGCRWCRRVQAFEASGFAPFRARFHARDALRGRAVVLSDGTTGTAQGTSETGGLLVHTAAGMNTVTSSEVSVRPAA